MSSEAISPTAIAVIGAALRVPGASTLDEFWDALLEGRASITRFSIDELLEEGISRERLADPRYVRARPVLEHAAAFEPEFFGMTPREARLCDPQQRIFLECAWEGLERAGIAAHSSAPLGIFASAGPNTYLPFNVLPSLGYDGTESMEGIQLLLLNEKDYVALRTAHVLGARGPVVTVQSACSSSLAAVHLAAQSLIAFECDLALAGGVRIFARQRAGYVADTDSIFSKDGYCRAFDADSTGCIFGSGAGVVVLKRLEDAIRDGDPIHAIIRGSAVNNDGGERVSFAAPGAEGQAAAIAEALGAAGIAAGDVDFIEAHGTGTRIGDTIEVEALQRAYGPRPEPRRLGSVKANIGHLDAAAGVISLIKACLSVERGWIPPSPNFRRMNPAIESLGSGFMVPTSAERWEPKSRPRTMGVSSLGIGGTNVHVIVEEPPVRSRCAHRTRPELLVASARSPRALAHHAAQLDTFVASFDGPLVDVASTLRTGRMTFEHRRAWVVDGPRSISFEATAAAVANVHATSVHLHAPPRGARARASRAIATWLEEGLLDGLDALQASFGNWDKWLRIASSLQIAWVEALVIARALLREGLVVDAFEGGTPIGSLAADVVVGRLDLPTGVVRAREIAGTTEPEDSRSVVLAEIRIVRKGGEATHAIASAEAQPWLIGILGAIGQAWTAGARLEAAAHWTGAARRCALPTYPFERATYWIDPPKVGPAMTPALPVAEAAPSTSDIVLETMLDIWTDVIGEAPASHNADFFAVGADSIDAIRAVRLIQDRLGVELRLEDFIKLKTLGRLVQHIRGDVDRLIAASVPPCHTPV